jgi:hypothetical protein
MVSECNDSGRVYNASNWQRHQDFVQMLYLDTFEQSIFSHTPRGENMQSLSHTLIIIVMGEVSEHKRTQNDITSIWR